MLNAVVASLGLVGAGFLGRAPSSSATGRPAVMSMPPMPLGVVCKDGVCAFPEGYKAPSNISSSVLNMNSPQPTSTLSLLSDKSSSFKPEDDIFSVLNANELSASIGVVKWLGPERNLTVTNDAGQTPLMVAFEKKKWGAALKLLTEATREELVFCVEDESGKSLERYYEDALEKEKAPLHWVKSIRCKWDSKIRGNQLF